MSDNTCKWCGDDYNVDDSGLCKFCREKKPKIEARLEKEWEIRHGRKSGATGFDEMYGTTHILDFGWAWKVSGQLLNEANYKAALKMLPEDYIFEGEVGHWATPYRCISIHIWDAEKRMPTPAWDVYEELQERMNQYPVLDEDLFSAIETEDFHETIKNCFDWELERALGKLIEEAERDDITPVEIIPDDWVEQIMDHEIVSNRGWSSGEQIESRYMDEIIEDLSRKWLQPILDPDGINLVQMSESKKWMRRLL